MFAKRADCHAANRREGPMVELLVNKARDLVLEQRIGDNLCERGVGQSAFGCHSFLLGPRGDSRKLIARFDLVGFGE